MAKRKAELASSDLIDDLIFSPSTSEHKFTKRKKSDQNVKKHTLDSDEEDFDDDTHMKEDDIEGEEDVVAPQGEGERFTAFNMREEMEEGHFDKDGHFIWNNEKEIRDNWLDDIDWQKVKQTSTKYDLPGACEKGLAESSDSDSEDEGPFNETDIYKQILSYLRPKESVSKAIQRYGGNKKPLSSLERLKLKKSAALTTNEEVTKLTELANRLLTKTGNMDIYQETCEVIQSKIEKAEAKKKKTKDEPEIDMYSEDFLEKEKEKKKVEVNTPINTSESKGENVKDDGGGGGGEVLWEFKWQQENHHIEGPFPTSRMLKWCKEGYFKKNVWVRKHGDVNNFYRSDRIDFEIYM